MKKEKAKLNSEKYEPRFRGVAEEAFTEGYEEALKWTRLTRKNAAYVQEKREQGVPVMLSYDYYGVQIYLALSSITRTTETLAKAGIYYFIVLPKREK